MDKNLRARKLAGKGIPLLGVGVSGGEERARHGQRIDVKGTFHTDWTKG